MGSEDSDQTGRMPRRIWDFAGRTSDFVGFVMRLLICFEIHYEDYEMVLGLCNVV